MSAAAIDAGDATARSHPALWALMVFTFSLGVGEFVVLGLLPEVANDLGVSVPSAGWLVTGYALGVAIGGPILAITTMRVPRRSLLAVLGVVFLAGTFICAIAPTYVVLMLGRILASLTHGAFVGAAVVVATRLVSPEREGAAVAAVIGGFTAATVVGVPLGTFVGQAFGWRSVFWAIAAVALLGWAAMMLLLPKSRGAEPLPDLQREFAALARPTVLAALATTALGFGGLFAAYTYIALFLTDVSGFATSSVPFLLLVFGIGAVIGNTIGGRLADRAVVPTVLGLLSILAATLVLLPILGSSQVMTAILLLVMGGAAFGATPGLQLRVVSEARDAPYLSSTMNVTAFNIGNAMGAFLGGLLIAQSGSLALAAWAGAAMAVLVTWSATSRQSRRTSQI
ncbi:MFS transporter [Notoacmeibacter marinus]|uniref:MFS transporter n=1 Tax=Notoacmeibacter marinus TaxID=1876515 RepID=UPI000DF2E5F7|nr:MFS transporter [Notoacmeibacter marinus]